MKLSSFIKRVQFALVALFFFASCTKQDVKDLINNSKKPPSNIPNIVFYALANGTRLDKLSTAHPEKAQNSATIAGLQMGETIMAIDFRPATGQLYGIGSTSRIYVINPQTGAARTVGTGPFAPALAGNIVGFDFNPAIDRIRVVTNSGQNLVINPETGTVATTATAINGAMIAAVAYTSNMAGAATTTLYDIDIASDKLFKQDPPNAGTLVEVGALKLKLEGDGGFDIAPDGTALALFEVNKKSTLFTIDLNTGNTTVIAKFNKAKDEMYTGIAIPTNPVAYAVGSMNSFLIFDPASPSSAVSKPIMGLQSGEMVLGIDFRPLNGQIYALGSTGRIYTLNASSGMAMLAGTLTIPLSGTAFGFDFNPVVDQIRIVSNTGQNLRFIAATGVTAMDSQLNPGAPAITAAAYTNNFAGATTTMLLDIDTNMDRLFQQTPPGAGTLVDKGPLNVNAEATNGFDIGGTSGMAYAALTSGGTTRMYMINLESGAAKVLV